MRVGLFVPCYVDAFEPDVGIATLELLERFGLDVDYPLDQTCCGQPMTNTGCHEESAATEALFVRNFAPYEYVVAPSGSCVNHVRCNLDAIEQTEQVPQVRARTYELVEYSCTTSCMWMRSPGPSSRTRSRCTRTATRCASRRSPNRATC